MTDRSRFARWLFRIAGIYGIAVVAPMYFMEDAFARDYPPPITHPEWFYGFVGVTLAWQVVYLLIATDPLRYRPLMLIGAASKLSFGIACALLWFDGRLASNVLAGAGIDGVLATLFVAAYARSRGAAY